MYFSEVIVSAGCHELLYRLPITPERYSPFRRDPLVRNGALAEEVLPCPLNKTQRAGCHEIKLTRASGLTLGLVLSLLLIGCASVNEDRPKEPPVTRVWPDPPAEPRLAYVQSIYTLADLGIKPSGWSRLGRWLTGLGRDTDKLGKPFGIALDEVGNLCLTDTGGARVLFLDRIRKRVSTWEGIGRLQFVAPVAVAKLHGTLFVADSGLGEVLIFDEQGKSLVEVKRELIRPAGLAVSGARLFVTDAAAHCVAVFDLQGNFLFKFGQRGSAPGQFNFPTHIAPPIMVNCS